MSAATGSTGGRGHDDDSGDISLSRPADKRPLAAGPAMPIPRNPKSSGIMRSSSVRLDRPPDGDVGERARSTTGYRATASPSPSPSPTATPTPRRQVSESPLSPLHARRMTRSRSLNVRIPSIDLTAKSVQSSTSATYLAPEISAPAPSPRPPPLIDDETASRMARWVKEIVVCNFDLERGPVVERRAGGRRPSLSRGSSFTSGGVLPPPPAMSLSGLKPFSLPSFLAHLKKHGPNPLSFKSKGLAGKARVENDFYAAFCMGACFAGWLAARVQSLGLVLAPMGSEGMLTPSGFTSARVSDSGLSSARVSGDTNSARVSGDTSGTSGLSTSASERSSVDDPGAAPRAIEPSLPFVADENAARRLGRLGIAD
ncbi:hypothetical protein CspHIS471_0308570 [Cutaneotrichosporon sp. HIS471]|nr:hypothetical protein CspHIS471_0308570 [Cutaneotrichosporon sp. HIS471]